MSDLYRLMRIFKLYIFIIIILPSGLYSQSVTEKNNKDNEITIFVVPSVVPIDWSNPSTLYNTSKKCFYNSIFRKNCYIIGHTIARITSPLLPAPYYIAMTGKKPIEKPELVLINKIGFGVLGATMQGEIESERNIKKRIETYSRRNKVAYLKFKINEQAVRRVLQFSNDFQIKTMNGYAPCDFYNGATYPRFENEGSGCSAFGISLLEVAGILPPASEGWRVSIKVPMNLIGGEFNNNKKIKLSSIHHTKTWYEGSGIEGVDFMNYKAYDPTLIYNWIKDTRTQNDSNFKVDEENGISGLVADMRGSITNTDEPIFLLRTDSDLFIKQYHRKIRNLAVQKKTTIVKSNY